MTELVFLYETDPQMGIPRLSAVDGLTTVWNPKEVQQMEDQLRSHYESFVREGQGTLQFKGNVLHVKKKAGDVTRQPTLEVHLPETAIVRNKPVSVPTPYPLTTSAPAPTSTDWYNGWLNEVERVVHPDKVKPAELAMLQVVWTELRALAGKTPPSELSLLLFAAIVSLADQLSRAHEPNQPHPFPFALSGIQRLLEGDHATPWGPLPSTPNTEPPLSWFGRFWNLLKGD